MFLGRSEREAPGPPANRAVVAFSRDRVDDRPAHVAAFDPQAEAAQVGVEVVDSPGHGLDAGDLLGVEFSDRLVRDSFPGHLMRGQRFLRGKDQGIGWVEIGVMRRNVLNIQITR